MRDLSQLPNLNLALVQTHLAWHDREGNHAHFEVLLEQARGADLVILPEMFTTGFTMDSERLAEPEQGPTCKWLKAQAKKLDAVITGSVIIRRQLAGSASPALEPSAARAGDREPVLCGGGESGGHRR